MAVKRSDFPLRPSYLMLMRRAVQHLATGRRPASGELDVLRDLLSTQRASYRRNRGAAEALLSVGESPRRTRMEAAELAAWTMVASTILNLDETITRH